jgi:hypothetical protein
MRDFTFPRYTLTEEHNCTLICWKLPIHSVWLRKPQILYPLNWGHNNFNSTGINLTFKGLKKLMDARHNSHYCRVAIHLGKIGIFHNQLPLIFATKLKSIKLE